MPNYQETLSKKAEVENFINDLEKRINNEKLKSQKLEGELSEQQQNLTESLQSIDYMESLKAQKLTELKGVMAQLSDADRKKTTELEKRREGLFKKCQKINQLIKELYSLYREVLAEGDSMQQEGYQRLFGERAVELDLPFEYTSGSNLPLSWLFKLPAIHTGAKKRVLIKTAKDLHDLNAGIL